MQLGGHSSAVDLLYLEDRAAHDMGWLQAAAVLLVHMISCLLLAGITLTYNCCDCLCCAVLCCTVGFFTGRKKESMFAVPEGGKVGVIGSGKGLTEYKKQTRHEFNVD